MKKMLAITILCFLPASAYALTDREVFELLSEKSQRLKGFPFQVYVAIPDYDDFRGTELPVSTYSFFASAYGELKDSRQPGELWATYKFQQGSRWACFLLRVPSMYSPSAIDLWVFDTQRGSWQEPLRIADHWGDAGYVIEIQAWIEDLNKDGLFDIVRRTLEEDIDIEPPKSGRKDAILLWEDDHFKDESREYLPRIRIDQYQFKKREHRGEPPGYY